MTYHHHTKIERQLRQLITPPAGFEAGSPSVEVTAKVSMYPKATNQPVAPKSRKKYKPEPMPVKIVGMVDKAKLGRR